MCPPYELVDYNELYDLLDTSPLLHEVHRPLCHAAGKSVQPCPCQQAPCGAPGLATTHRPCLSCPCALSQESIVIVGYPKKLASLVRERMGPLEKLRDRRYGRTYLAIYGPPLAEA